MAEQYTILGGKAHVLPLERLSSFVLGRRFLPAKKLETLPTAAVRAFVQNRKNLPRKHHNYSSVKTTLLRSASAANYTSKASTE